MGAEIINLRQARKARAREDKEKTAQANRVLHGTPKALRKLESAKKGQTDQRLSGHELEKPNGDN